MVVDLLNAYWMPRQRLPRQTHIPPGGVYLMPPDQVSRSAPVYVDARGRSYTAIGSTTAGIQEATDYLMERYGGGTLHLGVGVYTVTTPIDLYSGSNTLTGYWNGAARYNLQIVGSGPWATVIATATENAIADFDFGKSGGSDPNTLRLTLRDLGFEYTGTTHDSTIPLVRLESATIQANLDNLAFGANGYDRKAALEISDCWEINGRSLVFNELSQAIRYDSPNANGGNLSIDGMQCINVKLGMVVEGDNTTNSLNFKNAKFNPSSAPVSKWPDHKTITFAGVTAGQKATYEAGSTAIYVGTGLGLTDGQYLSAYVGHGSLQEVVRVTGYDEVNGELDLGSALVNDYTASSALSVEVVYGGSMAAVVMPSSPCVKFDTGHFEGCSAGVIATGSGTVFDNCLWGTVTLSNALGEGEEYGLYLTGKNGGYTQLRSGAYSLDGRADDILVKVVNDWDSGGNVGPGVSCHGVHGYSGGSFFPLDLDDIVSFDSTAQRRFAWGDNDLDFNRTTLTFSSSADEMDISGDAHVQVDLEVEQRSILKGGFVCEPSVVTAGSSMNGSNDYTVEVDTATASGATSHNLPSSPLDGQRAFYKDSGGSASTKNVTVSGNGNNIEGSATKIIQSNYGALEIQYSSDTGQWWIRGSIGTIT